MNNYKQAKKLGPHCAKTKTLDKLTTTQKDKIIKKHNVNRKLVKNGKIKNVKSEQLPPADPSTLMPLVKKF